MVIADFLNDPRTVAWHVRARQFGFGSSAATPIIVGGCGVGAVNFYAKNPDAFDGELVALITMSVLLKPNQVGTLSETRLAWQTAQKLGFGTIVSARSGETEDTTIAHLATGWNAGQLKVGSFSRSERMAKWNECLRIQEQLGHHAVYAGKSVLPLAL